MVGNSGLRVSLIIFAVFLVSVAVALFAASGEDIWHQLTLLSVVQFIVLLVLSLVNYLLRAARWHLYVRALKIGLGPLQVLRHYIGGFALTLTPARLGELVRLRWIASETGSKVENMAPLILVDRAGDLASTGLLLAFALAMGASDIAGGIPVALLAVAVAVVATRPKLFQGLITGLWRLTGRKARLFARMRRAARALRPFSSPVLVFPALVAGGIGWFAEGYAFFLLLDWMGAALPLWTAVSIFLFSMMTGGATGAPGGVGGAEAAMVALLSLQGVPLEVSIPATAIIRITTLWFAIGLGVIVFPFAEGIAARTGHALENR